MQTVEAYVASCKDILKRRPMLLVLAVGESHQWPKGACLRSAKPELGVCVPKV